MRRLLSVLTILGFLLTATVAAGCGSSGGASNTSPSTGPQTPLTTPSAKTTMSVFFVKGEVVSQVTRPAPDPTAEVALKAMLEGPTAAEKSQGYSTAVPAGTRLQSFTVSGTQATADFSKEMLNYGGGSAIVQAIVSQIDNTVLNNDKTLSTVLITVDGKPAEEVLQP